MRRAGWMLTSFIIIYAKSHWYGFIVVKIITPQWSRFLQFDSICLNVIKSHLDVFLIVLLSSMIKPFPVSATIQIQFSVQLLFTLLFFVFIRVMNNLFMKEFQQKINHVIDWLNTL